MATVVHRYVETILRGQRTASADTTLNVFHHFSADDPGILVSKSDWVTLFGTQLADSIIALLSNEWESVSIEVRNFDDPFDPYEVVPYSAPGGVNSEALPGFNAVSFQLRTEQRGRFARGRKHFGLVPENANDDGRLSAGALTSWQAVAANLMTSLSFAVGSGFTYKPVVWSKTMSDITSSIYVIELASVIVNPIIGTMKRRKEGVGV